MTEYKVLVPLDGSELSEGALAYLPLLQPLGDLVVCLLGVTEPGHSNGFPAKDAEDVYRSYLLHQELHLRGLGIAIESRLSIGEPALVINNEADSFHADLILMSTHARAGIERWRLGSVAEKVARLTYHDVLVVPPTGATPPDAIHNVLIPLDGSDVAENALPTARHWATAMAAQVHLTQVVTLATLSHDATGLHTDLQLDSTRTYLETQQHKSEARPESTAVVFGSPEESLVEYSRENAIDLIALTAHGRGAGNRVGLGRVARHLLRGEKAVLLLRSWEAGDLTARRRYDKAV